LIEQSSAYVGNFDYVIQPMKDQAMLWAKPLDDLCTTAKDVLVKDFIQAPKAHQVIDQEATLNNAFHRFVMFKHDSLFVMDGKKLVGLLRFSDVYREIGRKIKDTCGFDASEAATKSSFGPNILKDKENFHECTRRA
jgi:hypothetical protein